MKNLSNADSIQNWITKQENENTVKKESTVDSEERIKEIKDLKTDINFKTAQLEKKLNSLYDICPGKETYDNIVVIKSIKFYEN